MNKLLERKLARYFNTSGKEIIFSKGEGPYIYDTMGNKYIDFVLGYGPVVLGHANIEFNQRVAEFLQFGIHLPSYSPVHETYISQLIPENVFNSPVHVAFFKSSSEAITGAIRVASIVTGKMGVIRCGYCGWHDAQLAKSPPWHLPPNQRNQINHLIGFRGRANAFKLT